MPTFSQRTVPAVCARGLALFISVRGADSRCRHTRLRAAGLSLPMPTLLIASRC